MQSYRSIPRRGAWCDTHTNLMMRILLSEPLRTITTNNYRYLIPGYIAFRLFRIRLFPCSPIPYSPIPYSPFPCWPIPYSPSLLAYSVLAYSLTIPCSPIPYSPIPCSPIPCLPIPCSPIPYLSIPCSPFAANQTPNNWHLSFLLSIWRELQKFIPNLGIRCTMYIRTSCLGCWCLENCFIFCTYNLFPSQLLTKDNKYFHDLTRITSPLTQRYYIPR